jgi:hypothetical protein
LYLKSYISEFLEVSATKIAWHAKIRINFNGTYGEMVEIVEAVLWFSGLH